MDELKEGDLIKERYRLIRFLGNGSFGEVWLAEDTLSGREVALKMYLSLDPAGIKEFHREYANTRGLSSPYLLTPEYFDVYGRRPFLVMKYCKNGPCSKVAGKLTEKQIWQFIEDVVIGLAVLHNQSDPIVHQDIKPDNILIDENGHFLITDFGISKRLRATMRRQSKRDVSTGALPYMAPERFESEPKLNPASDVWSLGASIYELATGELPFNGFWGTMQRNGAEMPSLPSTYSETLNKFMQICLSLDENNRPTMSEFSKIFSNNNITGYEIRRPDSSIELNISGHITQTRIIPDLGDKFYFLIFLIGIIFISHWGYGTEELSKFISLAIDINSIKLYLYVILECILVYIPITMFFVGLYEFLCWSPIGKYLMYGGIYILMADKLDEIIYVLFHYQVSQFAFNEMGYNYDLNKFLTGIIFSFMNLILIYFVRIIKKYSKLNPAIMWYHGSKVLPILYEFVFPGIVILFLIIESFKRI